MKSQEKSQMFFSLKSSKDEESLKMNEIIDKQIETYINDGPYVYELYSIMMHQGSATGGHYYSYIKSFETKTWYKFNDSFVGKVRFCELIEAYGDDLPKGRYFI